VARSLLEVSSDAAVNAARRRASVMLRHVPHVLIAGSAVLILIACSSSSTSLPGGEPGSSPKKDGGTTVAVEDGGKPSSSTKSAGVCDGKASCEDVCESQFPGRDELWGKTIDTCVCQACAAECGTNECAGKMASDACIECRMGTKGDACYQKADTACSANKDCKGYRDCIGKCPLPPMPEAPGDGGVSGGGGETSGLEDCASCCAAANQKDAPYWQKKFDDCACTTDCKDACATTVCAGKPAEDGSECQYCLYTTKCAATVNEQCKTDPGCSGWPTCMDSCRKAGKKEK
jgi:hypothetical protein